MSNEWRDLPTLADVAAAQAAGDEIEVGIVSMKWGCPVYSYEKWRGKYWDINCKFSARPAQPKMKKVKLLCWYDGTWLQWANESHSEVVADTTKWKRVPAEDKEIEVPE